MKREENRGS